MNFYEYYDQNEKLDASAVYLAAKDLMEKGIHVIPLKKGEKEPHRITSIYKLIANPINAHNFNFYFNPENNETDLGIMLDNAMEFIDIDEKNKKGITHQVLKAIQCGWPELYEKLVIDFTPSGGCHIIYRSELIGGKPWLAKVKASPNPLAVIERISRHNKQYIKISPSEGYTLRQGNPFDIPFITAEERNFICAVCASFHEVPAPEVKKKESEREDSPWFVFNEANDWKYIRNELIDRNWQVYRDEADKVMIKRPGDSKQKYSGVIFKDSGTLYLFTPSTEFQNEKAYSSFGVYCMLYHDNNVAAACKQLASEGCGKNIFDEGQFWVRDGKKIKIKYTDLLAWYHSIGYRKYAEHIVQVVDNVVHIVDESTMKQVFLNEVEFEMQDDMFERVATIFNEKGGLMSMVQKLEPKFIRDTKDETWLFFRNIATRITSQGVEPVEYKTIDGYIWASDIMARDYYGTDFTGCDAERFIDILGGDQCLSLKKIIGYLMSRYKDALNPRAVILMEDIDAEHEGESQGGSGKGLCVQFVKQFRKTIDMDGKNFRFTDPFLFQNVTPDTSVILIDDIEKGFKFTSMFSILTGPLSINRKNREQVIIPYEDAPKIVFTSNYAVGGMDASSRRRKYEFPVVKYFGDEIEPVMVFNRQFFTGWDAVEWLRFDNFMISCAQLFLSESDKRSIGVTTGNTAERSLMTNTNREFIDYMDGQLRANFFDFAPNIVKRFNLTGSDGSLTTNAVDVQYYRQHSDNPDFYMTYSKQAFTDKIIKMTNLKHLTTTRVTQWLNRWATARGVEIDSSYKRMNGERDYRIISWDENFPLLGSNNSGKTPNEKSEDSCPF
jgi:hypothetical protein